MEKVRIESVTALFFREMDATEFCKKFNKSDGKKWTVGKFRVRGNLFFAVHKITN